MPRSCAPAVLVTRATLGAAAAQTEWIVFGVCSFVPLGVPLKLWLEAASARTAGKKSA
jgi:hypothetical protein